MHLHRYVCMFVYLYNCVLCFWADLGYLLPILLYALAFGSFLNVRLVYQLVFIEAFRFMCFRFVNCNYRRFVYLPFAFLFFHNQMKAECYRTRHKHN